MFEIFSVTKLCMVVLLYSIELEAILRRNWLVCIIAVDFCSIATRVSVNSVISIVFLFMQCIVLHHHRQQLLLSPIEKSSSLHPPGPVAGKTLPTSSMQVSPSEVPANQAKVAACTALLKKWLETTEGDKREKLARLFEEKGYPSLSDVLSDAFLLGM